MEQMGPWANYEIQQDNEGHIGFRVTEVAKAANKTIPQKPNLVLIK